MGGVNNCTNCPCEKENGTSPSGHFSEYSGDERTAGKATGHISSIQLSYWWWLTSRNFLKIFGSKSANMTSLVLSWFQRTLNIVSNTGDLAFRNSWWHGNLSLLGPTMKVTSENVPSLRRSKWDSRTALVWHVLFCGTKGFRTRSGVADMFSIILTWTNIHWTKGNFSTEFSKLLLFRCCHKETEASCY